MTETPPTPGPYEAVVDIIDKALSAAVAEDENPQPVDDAPRAPPRTEAQIEAIQEARRLSKMRIEAQHQFTDATATVKRLAAEAGPLKQLVQRLTEQNTKKGDPLFAEFGAAKKKLKELDKALSTARRGLSAAAEAIECAKKDFKTAFAATGLAQISDLAKSESEPVESEKIAEDSPAFLEPRAWGYDVDRLNSEYAFVLMGSKAVVVREQPDAAVEDRVRILSIDAFVAYYLNKLSELFDAKGNIKAISWGKRWLADRERRTFDGIEFHPDPQNAGGQKSHLNLWRGFSVIPDAKAGTYGIFKDHILTNVCNGDITLYNWIFGWFAHLVQRPRERSGTALVFKGKMGTGKTKIGEIFGSLIENHYFLVDDPRYITGQFNAHMASCLLLQAEEAVWAGDKTAEGRLKSLITSNIQMIEAKGIDPIRVTNYVHLVMTSNEDWVVPAGMDERRFAVFDIAATVKGNFSYFKEMDEQLNAGGREALLADLLSFDLSQVELRDIPKTQALLEQKIRSLGHVEYWWFERLMMGTQRAHTTHWFPEVSKSDLISDYLNQAEKIGIRRRSGEVEVGMKLSRLVPELGEARRWVDVTDQMGNTHRAQKRCWLFPSLQVCREAFEEAVQQQVKWPTDNEFEQASSSEGRDDE